MNRVDRYIPHLPESKKAPIARTSHLYGIWARIFSRKYKNHSERGLFLDIGFLYRQSDTHPPNRHLKVWKNSEFTTATPVALDLPPDETAIPRPARHRSEAKVCWTVCSIQVVGRWWEHPTASVAVPIFRKWHQIRQIKLETSYPFTDWKYFFIWGENITFKSIYSFDFFVFWDKKIENNTNCWDFPFLRYLS